MVSLTRDQSLKSKLQIWKALHNVTSLQGSEVGHTHFASQESPMISRAGQEAHHANHLASPVSNSGRLMRGTSPQPLCASLTSASLQSSLASKLRQRLESTGSTIYSLSWKDKVTPAGRPYCQRAASVRRTKEIGCSSVPLADWVTPTCSNTIHSTELQFHERNQRCKARHGRGMGMPMQTQVLLAAWPTPNCMGSMGMRSEEALARAKLKGGCSNLKDVLHELKYNEHPTRITAVVKY